ncbi:MAG: biosynthetic-type acetolactate synthase large subunit [Bacteroidaceae bacterium]|nr:biosynthetic-type acetolactate synthase large subunit [Bacteroidaceae bacterium]
MNKELISGGEALLRSLKNEGVDTLFGYPGGSIIPVFDSLYDYKDEFRNVLVRHEQAAVHAAQGYARSSGKVGVCIVTSGPGATNTLTGISDALLDSTPVVIIAGQVSSAVLGTDAFQEIDLVGVTQPISKWSYQVRKAEDVAWAVSRAFYIASTGRPGPVVLDFTKDAQIAKVLYEPVKVDSVRSYIPYPTPCKESIKKAAELINRAKRPFALIGQGVELGNAHKELTAFLEKADIPAARTLLGLSAFPSEHPLCMGMLGMHGNLGPNVNTNECDVLIAIGMRFSDRVTGNIETYAKQAKIIHLDIDKVEIDKNISIDIPVLGDCKETLPMITELLEENSHKEWIDSFAEFDAIEKEKVIDKALYPADGPILMGEVARKVSEATGNTALLVTDVGQNQMFAARYFKYKEPHSIITSGGLGTMGFGLPAAMGATMGAPHRTVCYFAGDGGFQMNIQELGTIMEQKCPVKMVVMDNSYLGMVRQWQNLFYDNRYSWTPMCNPDFCKIADGYGIPSRLVTDRSELDAAIKEMFETEGAFLLSVVVRPEDNVMPMMPLGASVCDMILE